MASQPPTGIATSLRKEPIPSAARSWQATSPTECGWTTLLSSARTPLDPTLFSASELGSFGRGNYTEVVIGANKRFAQHYQFFANYTWSRNFGNASSERDTETFYGPQDPFDLNLDYGRDGLDITHQLKGGIVVDLPKGFNWSSNFIIHSGLAYPAYSDVDLNGDAVMTSSRTTIGLPCRSEAASRSCSGISRTPAGFLQLGYAHRERHHV